MAAFGSDKWYVSTPYGLVQLCIVDCITLSLSLSLIQTHTNTHSSIDFYVLHSPPCHGSLCRPFLILQRVWTYSFFIYIYIYILLCKLWIPLFWNAAAETRPVEPGYAPGHSVMFSDMYPYMLLSQVGQVEKWNRSFSCFYIEFWRWLSTYLLQGSMDALNKLLREPIPVNRFRPKYLLLSYLFILFKASMYSSLFTVVQYYWLL